MPQFIQRVAIDGGNGRVTDPRLFERVDSLQRWREKYVHASVNITAGDLVNLEHDQVSVSTQRLLDSGRGVDPEPTT